MVGDADSVEVGEEAMLDVTVLDCVLDGHVSQRAGHSTDISNVYFSFEPLLNLMTSLQLNPSWI